MKFALLILFSVSSVVLAKPTLTEIMEKTRCLPRRSALTGEIEGESCYNPKDVRAQKNTEKGDAPLKKADSKKSNDEEVEKLMKDIE